MQLHEIQNPDPGSLKNLRSSGVDSRPRMAKIWNERVGIAAEALDDGLVAQSKAPGAVQARLRKQDHRLLVHQADSQCMSGRQAKLRCAKGRSSLTPRILQPRHPVEHRLRSRHMIRTVRHKVPKALKLKLLVRLRSGQ